MNDWEIASLWNDLLQRPDRDENPEPRNHLWASELGSSMVDTYLKLHGVAFSNGPNDRAFRKFEAGRYFENIVKFMFKRAGILQAAQEHLKFQYPGLLEVTGYNDLRVGDHIDLEQSKRAIEQLASLEVFTPKMFEMTRQVAEYLASLGQLAHKHVEVKSVSLMMFEKIEKTQKPQPQHLLQLYHYLKAKPLDGGVLFYICRDDLRLIEFNLKPDDANLEQMYYSWIENITNYWKKGEQPPLEPFMYFDFDSLKFTTNWRVQYSPYLTKLYGFENEGEFFETFKNTPARYNRVVTRLINSQIPDNNEDGSPKFDKYGKQKMKCTLTKNNLEVIDEIKKTFPNWEEINDVLTARAKELQLQGSQEEDQDE